MGSIAKVKGLIDAIHPSQCGIKEIGANAVLAKSKGKLITNINAISSIWPGKINAKHKLIDVTNKTKSIKVENTIPKPKNSGNP